MSVIIRLQNLPWSANALDIRQYFRGLSIPEGGVHIVGGELGDAFIAFSTDEDARQAFQLDNGKIKEVQVKLLLSSRTEMQRVIEAARTAQTPFMQTITPVITPTLISSSQMPVTTTSQPAQEDAKKEDVNKDSSRSRRDRSGRRRSRSRTRSRDRKDRDRSRDRRDRKRRDRSRSRDRKDRRRDRRGRSRSRDRTRSKERDSRRNHDRKDNKSDVKNNDDKTWEKKSDATNIQQVGLLGNFPAIGNSFEDTKRSMGITGNTNVNDNNNRYQRNDTKNTDSWGKNRFPDNNNQFSGNMSRNFTNTQGDAIPNLFSNPRMPLLNQDNSFNNNNRAFLNNRSGPYSDRGSQFPTNNDQSYRRENKRPYTPNTCVQLRPYYGGYGEVRKFFHGLFISNSGVKLITDKSGKRTGAVYVRFVYLDGKEQALSRSGFLLRGVPVEITHLDDSEFDDYRDDEDDDNGDSNNQTGQDEFQELRVNEQDNSSHAKLKHFTCVVVDDLPEFAKEHDILKLFSDYTILSVYMVINNMYRQLAYVQFDKKDEAKKAISDKTSHVISGKPVTVMPISDEIFAEIQCKQDSKGNEVVSESNFGKNENHSPSSNSPKLITDVVLLTGMPHKTTERDVVDFFSDVGIAPIRIHMLLGKFGPYGECYCEFNNPDQANCAASKNGMSLGAGTVNVELFPRRDMERKLGMMSNQNSVAPVRFPGRFGPPRGPPNLLGGPRVLPPPNMMIRRRPQLPPQSIPYDGPLDQIGPPGCVVSMENVPFKAGIKDIVTFFSNYHIHYQDILRRFNDNGGPTGDARVTFQSSNDARRAVEECNKTKMQNRTIFLKLL